MKTYSKDDILLMGKTEFTDKFKVNSYVIITFSDGASIDGKIQEIGLASNLNIDTRDHLPVSIKVAGKSIDIFTINKIQVQ